MRLSADDRYQLMKEEEADARDAKPSVVEALGMWSGWHADVPFDGSRGDPKLDLALADAFRMLIYLREPKAQFAWIERELRPAYGRFFDEYESALCRYWLDIYDNEQRNRRYG